MIKLQTQLSLIICFASTFVGAQNALPFRPSKANTWEQIKPLWYETYYVEKTKSDICDGYNGIFNNSLVDPKVVGKYLYTTYQMSTPLDMFAGGYIDKRDIETGKITW
jgi:hypothetical protein